MKNLKTIVAPYLFITLGTLFISCAGEDETSDEPGGGSSVSNALHLKFKTPDWERTINCEQLDLEPFSIADNVFGVAATSASTNETFYFSYPKDSSAMNKTSNYKKYAIADYGENDEAFQFSQKLPDNAGSNGRLISMASDGTTYYNEVEKIEYVGNEPDFAIFKVRCRYNMKTYLLNSETTKDVSGTFHFKIRTTRN